MDHQALSRPSLPGSTPAPINGGKSNAYTTNAPARLEQRGGGPGRAIPLGADTATSLDAARRTIRSPSTKELIRSTSAKQRQRVLQEKTLTKIVAKLPYDLRETVTAVLTMAFSTSENIQKDLDVSNQEAAVLKNDLSRKIAEINTLTKSIDNYKSRIKILEESVDTLKDNVEARQKFSLKNRSAMTRLATTNRMLIDALDALQASGAHPLAKTLSTNQSTLDDSPPPGRIGQLAPLQHSQGQKVVANHDEYEEKMKTLANSQNEKLRESLLKIAREHYRSMKNVEHLENKVGELKLSLRAQEQVNRNLKTELDELKTIHLADAQEFEDNKASIDASNINFRQRSFGLIDDRFKAMLERNLFDPIDGIQQLRRILAHLATSPTTLSITEMISHVVSRDALRIFDSEMICLFLVRPGSENMMHRFTARSAAPASFDMHCTRSLAADTICAGKVLRANNLAKCANFNVEIDGCSGVLAKRILSLPLINTRHNVVIGALQFINKGSNNDVFAEIDEIFGLIYAYQTSLMLTSCVMYDALFYHSQLLRGLLEASTELYGIIPEPASLAQAKSLSVGEVLVALERTARDLLKSPNVRAFLVSDSLRGEPVGEVVFLAPLGGSHNACARQHKSGVNVPLRSAAHNAGIVGHVLATRTAYLTQQGELDALWNPTVDLDPLESSMMTLPVMDLYGTVLGALQLVVGSRSPRLKHTEDPNDFRLFFGQAAEWLCHQLAAPLKYLLDYVGRPALRPVSTPSRMNKSSVEGSHRPSFFSSSEEVVAQVVSNPQHGAGRHAQHKRAQVLAADEEFESFQAIPLREIDSSASETFSLPHDHSAAALLVENARERALSAAENDKSHSDKRVRFGDAAVCADEQRVTELEAERARLADALGDLTAQLDARKEELQQQQDALREQLSAAEEEKRQVGASLLLAEQDKVVLTRELKEATEASQQREQALKRELSEREQRIDELAREHSAAKSREEEHAVREKDLQRKVAELDAALVGLQSQHSESARAQSSLHENMQDLSAQNERQAEEISRLLAVVKALEQKVAERDRTQAILQDQVVKLANQSFDSAVGASAKPAAPETALSPSVPDEADAAVSSPAKDDAAGEVAVSPSSPFVALNSAELGPNSNSMVFAEMDVDSVQHELFGDQPVRSEDDPVAYVDAMTTPNDVGTVKQVVENDENAKEADPSPVVPEEVEPVAEPTPSASASARQALVLPRGWEELKDDFERTYFYHAETGTSSWTVPDENTVTTVAAAPGALRSEGDWDQYFDDSGTEYWLNRVTGQSSWTLPSDSVLGSAIEDVDEEDLASRQRREREAAGRGGDPYQSSASQFSISAGDYTIEL